MRKITSEAMRAFEDRGNYKNANTEVKKEGPNTSLYLHGNKIAHFSKALGLGITNAGWFTATTKERLNALVGVHIVQKAGVWYLNGLEWSGGWVTVNQISGSWEYSK